jgi:hypothetical protein
VTTIFTTIWWAWIGVFALTEGAALVLEYFDRRRDITFSELFWRIFHVRDPRPTWLAWVLRAGALAGLVWLTGHLAFGWWTL